MSDCAFPFREVYRAWLNCRRGKRSKRSALLFETDAIEELRRLSEDLSAHAWRPLPSVCFVARSPKPREVFAAHFRDRVVHHILVSRLEPAWERRFIHDSYACRKGKGTHAAVERLRAFMRKVSANGSRRAWFLHLDVRSFFVSIDKKVLFGIHSRKVEDPELLWLLETLIFHDPTTDPVIKGGRRRLAAVPPSKSLFFTGNRTGLPIGNYTSQFFANVYLDALDQFVKHELKCRYYLRYVDDFVLLDPDRERLEAWEARIADFLRVRLALELNPRSRELAPVSNGCDFLGYVTRPGYTLPRRRVVNNLRERLRGMGETMVKVRTPRVVFSHDPDLLLKLESSLASFQGHLRHAACRKVLDAVRREFPWLGKYFTPRRDRFEPLPKPPRFRRLRDQYRWFAARWGWAVMPFRVGARYEFYGPQGRKAARLASGLMFRKSRKGLGQGFSLSSGLLPVFLNRAELAGLPVAIVEQSGFRRGFLMDRKLVELKSLGG
jgi:hypothetical protein